MSKNWCILTLMQHHRHIDSSLVIILSCIYLLAFHQAFSAMSSVQYSEVQKVQGPYRGGSKWDLFFGVRNFLRGGSFWPPGIFNVPMNLALFVGITLLACMAKRQLEHHERHSMLQLIFERRWVTLRLGSECVVVWWLRGGGVGAWKSS